MCRATKHSIIPASANEFKDSSKDSRLLVGSIAWSIFRWKVWPNIAAHLSTICSEGDILSIRVSTIPAIDSGMGISSMPIVSFMTHFFCLKDLTTLVLVSLIPTDTLVYPNFSSMTLLYSTIWSTPLPSMRSTSSSHHRGLPWLREYNTFNRFLSTSWTLSSWHTKLAVSSEERPSRRKRMVVGWLNIFAMTGVRSLSGIALEARMRTASESRAKSRKKAQESWSILWASSIPNMQGLDNASWKLLERRGREKEREKEREGEKERRSEENIDYYMCKYKTYFVNNTKQEFVQVSSSLLVTHL